MGLFLERIFFKKKCIFHITSTERRILNGMRGSKRLVLEEIPAFTGMTFELLHAVRDAGIDTVGLEEIPAFAGMTCGVLHAGGMRPYIWGYPAY